MKKIYVVYQDCVMCGDKGKEKMLEIAQNNDVEIIKVSFASPAGAKYCKEAIEKGVKRLPFYTDGAGTYAQDLGGFIATPVKIPAVAKKTVRKRKTAKKKGA